MISRLTATATLFAILATAGLGFAAEARQRTVAAQPAAASAEASAVIMLPAVVITGRRLKGV